MKIIIAGLAFLFSLTTSLPADDAQRRIDRFELFNDCKPIAIVIESLSSDAKKINLTGETLMTALSS